MFFHWTNFKSFLSEDQAKYAAKLMNDLIDREGKVVYGTLTSDEQCVDFSSEKKKTDTHVGIVLGVEQMGALKPLDSPPKIDKPTEEDFYLAIGDKNKALEKENEVLRNQLKSRGN